MMRTGSPHHRSIPLGLVAAAGGIAGAAIAAGTVAFAHASRLRAARDARMDADVTASRLRLDLTESAVERLRDAGRPDLRDMGSAALDAARARKLNAQAEKLERDIQAEHGPPPDDGANPVQVERWSVHGRSDLGTVHAKLSDRRGRDYALTFLPDRASEWAEQLLDAARFAEKEGA